MKPWLVYALSTMALWGVWGALTGMSAARGFPDTLVYCVWAATMIVPTLIVLARDGFRIDAAPRAILHGGTIGFLGAGGQLLLFRALTEGPAYLIFPIISLSPVITIALSYLFLRERTNFVGVLGIALALAALPLFDFSPKAMSENLFGGWLSLALMIMAAWGLQAYFMKRANEFMSAQSIFFYMTVTGLLLAPIAIAMTDFGTPVNWGLDGPWLAAVIQSLNAVGALFLVYAFRRGKAIVVSPLTNAGAPLMTALISMALLGAAPGPYKLLGIALAAVASLLLAIAPERSSDSR